MERNYTQLLRRMCEQHPFKSMSAHVYDILLDEIISGRLPCGTIVRQSDISEQFGLSRTPVREAIAQLTADGYIEKNDQGILRIYVFNPHDYAELQQFRIQLEVLAIRLTSLHLDSKTITLLHCSLDKLKKAGENNDISAALAADDEFHTAIINGCRNRYVISTYSLYAKKIQFYRNVLSDRQNWASTYRFHKKIVDALADRNPDAGIQYLKQHLNLSQELAMLTHS